MLLELYERVDDVIEYSTPDWRKIFVSAKKDQAELARLREENTWMRREIERVGDALFTNARCKDRLRARCQMIVDIAHDRDGYVSAEQLGELVDELAEWARGEHDDRLKEARDETGQ